MTHHGLFFKLDVNFPEHPRTLELSDAAFRALVELWCYSKRLNTDGKVPLSKWKEYHYQVRRKLVGHYVIEHADHVEMAGYLEHQQSAEELAELHKRRAEAGKLGGRAKARAKQTPRQNSSHIEEEEDQEEEEDLLGKPSREGAATRRRAVALPSNFALTDSMRLWAKETMPGVNIEWETEQFQDWHRSHGKTYKDWEAAWRNWMRKARPTMVVAEQPKDWWFDS